MASQGPTALHRVLYWMETWRPGPTLHLNLKLEILIEAFA